jgi:hypothetical protein
MKKTNDSDSNSNSDDDDGNTSNEIKNEKRRLKFIKKSSNRYQINLFDEFLNKIEEVYEFEVCFLAYHISILKLNFLILA